MDQDSEIQKHIANFRRRFIQTLQSGFFVRFTCTPTAAKLNETVNISAAVFSPSDRSLGEIIPWVGCMENQEIQIYLYKNAKASDSEIQFEGTLNTEQFNLPGSYTLTLHLPEETDPIANTVLHILREKEIEDLKHYP